MAQGTEEELLDGYEVADVADDSDVEDAPAESEEIDVAEHLKDAVEGSMRLKRLLSHHDEEEDEGHKRRRMQSEEVPPETQELVMALLKAWGAEQDTLCKYVLTGLELHELKHMGESGYVPGKTPPAQQSWSIAEHVARYCQERRESCMPGRLRIDIVDAFAHRCNLGADGAAQLRELNHKDLRFVLENYDGKGSLEECIQEARSVFPAEVAEDPTEAAPHRPGSLVMSRFNRLELIDPMADCAVFGDANLTFAKNLAEHRKDLGHAGRVVATTFEDIKTLRKRYQEIDDSIRTLEQCEAEVYHEVDCTRIALDDRFHGMENKFGAVYYNFPHSGSVGGFYDSHPLVNWRHENLMRLLFRALRTFMQPGGVVKIASNAKAVGMRFSFILESAAENEFIHTETLPFLEWHLHRYGRSYGDKRDVARRPDEKNNESYRRQKEQWDMVYCFSYKPSGETLEKQRIRMPPTLPTLVACTDGPFSKIGSNHEDKLKLAKRLHERFRKEVSGMHVG